MSGGALRDEGGSGREGFTSHHITSQIYGRAKFAIIWYFPTFEKSFRLTSVLIILRVKKGVFFFVGMYAIMGIRENLSVLRT